MFRTFARVACGGLLLAALNLMLPADASAQIHRDPYAINCQPIDYGSPDLFYNSSVDSTCSQVGAQLYISPVPVPPHVGHTWITYQPFYPDEYLYPHYHSYHRYYDGGRGMTRAMAVYYYPPARTAVKGVAQHLRIPR